MIDRKISLKVLKKENRLKKTYFFIFEIDQFVEKNKLKEKLKLEHELLLIAKMSHRNSPSH